MNTCIRISIAYEHSVIPKGYLPALLIKNRFGTHWWPLYRFSLDVSPLPARRRAQ